MKSSTIVIAPVCLSFCLLSHSGAADPPETETPPGWVKVTGRVRVTSKVSPPPPLVKSGTSPVDSSVCAKESDIPDLSLVIGKDGGLANVFVYLYGREELKRPDEKAVSEPAVLSCRECQFFPHALVMSTKQKLRVRNEGLVSVNTQFGTFRNGTSNFSLAPRSENEQSFKRSEPLPFKVKDAIHSWASAWILPLDHECAAVTDKDGKFEFLAPAGKRTIFVWHERARRAGLSRDRITITENSPYEIDFDVDIEDGKPVKASRADK